MKFKAHYILAVVICMAEALGNTLQKPEYEYGLVKIMERRGGFAFPADFEVDGHDEIVFLNDGGICGDVSVVTQQENYYSQKRFGPDVLFYVNRMSYFYNSWKGPVVLTCRFGDSLFALPLQGDAKWAQRVFLQKRPLIKGLNHPDWSGYFIPAGFFDIDGDSHKDLIGVWSTGLPNFPRGIAAYDLVNGKELWFYKMGAQVHDFSCILKDVNRDGVPEILCGTSSSANGADFNGTNDMNAYVIALDIRGHPLWSIRFERIFCNLLVFDAQDAEEYWKFFCLQQSQGRYEGAPDTIMILDARDGTRLKAVPCGKQARPSVSADIFNTGEIHLVTGNSDGRIRIYSSELDLLGEYFYSEDIPVNVMGVDDFDGDGGKEIIAISQDRAFLVLNNKYEAVYKGEHPFFNEMGFFSNVRHGSQKRFLTTTSIGPGNNLFQLWKLSKRPVIAQKGFRYAFFTVCAFMILVCFAVIYHRAYNKMILLEKSLTDLPGVGAVIMDKKGRVTFYNPWAVKLLMVDGQDLKQKRISDIFPGIEPEFDGRLKVMGKREGSIRVRLFKSGRGMVAFLTDETWHDYCKRIASWAPVAQEMAHGIKTPLTTILLASQKISSILSSLAGSQTAAKYSRSIEEEAQRLQRVADGFMRFVQMDEPAKTAVDLTSYVKDIVDEKRTAIYKSIVIDFKSSPYLPVVYIDLLQMKTALSNIIDNAINAVSEGGRIEVNARRIEKIGSVYAEEMVEITVTDNGCGIKETYLNQLFTPFASFRSGGTGLGLVLSKKIIEGHGGTIRIESKENHGTVVFVMLPSGGKA
jgi:nitrogen-specific signal transduction histidine kinase